MSVSCAQKNKIGQLTYILHQAAGSRGYTGKTRLRGLKHIDFALVRAGGLGLYSRDF
ncbi:hypothetical protein [Nostoc sp. 'Peltigera membranacea cyanobiont' 210A]|uniref:hypothetical protein n=1 Tax=Nostoc sp. 'Peltigera membranacea cyanobiont' 210A TaxID=2014529 RepID=UPI00167E5ABD|nr:hypothetical protein [Nostoc sp. 'Peltigera membranacea cyanobiont' 210A]